MTIRKLFLLVLFIIFLLGVAIFVFQPSFGPNAELAGSDNPREDVASNVIPFNADSAYMFCERQCSFGPRVMNSEAHAKCGEWIKAQFRKYGCEVDSQLATLTGYDGTSLRSENIIAHFNSSCETRILLCAHWDSRPWADNDPVEANHHTPVMAANDGASGVAVMLEIARALCRDSANVHVGIDFICFDAEDYGTPQWAGVEDDPNSWALGAQYWANQVASNLYDQKFDYQFGILLDMVGGEGAKFYQEGMSMKYAPEVVDKVWIAANNAGYGSFFPKEAGGYITDDHIPVNDIACIPCIDIIAYYPDCQQSSFGPTWHTVNDTMDHISKSTLKAVGQTLLYIISEY